MVERTKPHVILGTESWLDGSILSSEVFPDDYTIFRKDRDQVCNRSVFGPMKNNETHGGVFVAISSEIVCSEVPEMDSDSELIWAKIQITGSKDMFIGSFYRQPRTGPEYLDHINSSLNKLAGNDAIIVLGGDFNLPDIEWPQTTVRTASTRVQLHQTMLDIAMDHGLEQVIHQPTFDSNTLDLIFTNRPAFINRTEVLPGICRHHIALCEMSTAPNKVKPKARKIQIHKRADTASIKTELEQFRSNFLAAENMSKSANDLWVEFKTAFLSIIDRHVPTKLITPRNNNLPWMNTTLRRLCSRRKKLYAKVTSTADKEKYRQFSKHVDKEIKKAYFKHLEELFTPSVDDKGWDRNKGWYTYLKSMKRESKGITALKQNGRLFSNDSDKAELLNNQFYSVFNQDDTSSFPDLGPSPHPPMADIVFSSAGIEKLLKDLNPRKAPGPDGIGSRYLKEFADIIAPCLQLIFTKSYRSGHTPHDWRNANVCPIFKKGERYDVGNYRPVSLTSITSKIMEHCIVSNMLDHFEENDILFPYQHGFRRRLSTETQLVSFTDELTNLVSNGGQVDAIVLDFSKAFDKVCHRRLMHKLTFYGVTGHTNNWIHSFLSDRHQRVVVNQVTSKSLPVRSGVPQGTVLGPVLFLAFINDMPQSVRSSNVRLFADDAIIYRSVETSSDSEHLQHDLAALERWELDWSMSFNPAKCSHISFTRRRNPIINSYSLHETTLEKVSSVKYLGVTLTSNLTWTHHISNVVSKANQVLGIVRRNLKVAPTECKAQAYTTLIRPHLEYCSSVWDPHTQQDIQRLEAVQRRAARFCFRSYHRTSSPTEMLNKLGWPDLAVRRSYTRLILLFKMCHGLVNVDTSATLLPITRPTRHSHPFTFQRPASSQNYHSLSFFPRTISQWNGLPASLVGAPSVEAFSSGLRAAAQSLSL